MVGEQSFKDAMATRSGIHNSLFNVRINSFLHVVLAMGGGFTLSEQPSAVSAYELGQIPVRNAGLTEPGAAPRSDGYT